MIFLNKCKMVNNIFKKREYLIWWVELVCKKIRNNLKSILRWYWYIMAIILIFNDI